MENWDTSGNAHSNGSHGKCCHCEHRGEVTGLIMSMGRVITSVALTGFGFQDIGVGIIITNTGSTAITRLAKRTAFLLGPPFE